MISHLEVRYYQMRTRADEATAFPDIWLAISTAFVAGHRDSQAPSLPDVLDFNEAVPKAHQRLTVNGMIPKYPFNDLCLGERARIIQCPVDSFPKKLVEPQQFRLFQNEVTIRATCQM